MMSITTAYLIELLFLLSLFLFGFVVGFDYFRRKDIKFCEEQLKKMTR